MASPKPDLWTDVRPGCAVLFLPDRTQPVIVLHVLQKSEDEWVVTSSHGAPKGEHASKATAQKYAEKFAATMIEKTLGSLSELEHLSESPTNGYKSQACGLLVLSLDPHDDFLEDGEVHPEIFEQKKNELIGKHRASLRSILASLSR